MSIGKKAAKAGVPLPSERNKLPKPPANPSATAGNRAPAAHLVSRSLDQIQARDIDWLWEGRVPFGMLTMIDGDPAHGKSLITLDLASRLTRGDRMPFHDKPVEPKSVLIVAAEDAVEQVIKPRAVAAGCVERMVRVSETMRIRGQERPIRLPDDFDLLEREIVEYKVGLLIIDPLLGFLSQSVDSHKDQSIRDVLHHFKLITDRTGIAGIGLRHMGKAGSGNALYRGLGSIAIVAAARAAYCVDWHPTESGSRVFAPTKCNLGSLPKSISYRISEHLHQPVVNWQHECDITAEELGAKFDRGAGGSHARSEAKEFLRDLLSAGEVQVSEIKKQAKASGISESTLERAKRDLRIIPHKSGFSSSTWAWQLPSEDGQPIPD